MLIGTHVSVADGIQHAVDRQVEIGGNCGQIFTTSPQVWAQPELPDAAAEQFRQWTAAADVGPWLIHSAYLVNLATPDPDLRKQSVASLQAEVDAADRLDISFINVHLGAHTGAGVAAGLENAASALGSLDIPDGVSILIESDAGAGTKLGGEFEHLATVLDACAVDLEVCLDTAHLFAAGYDLTTEAAVETTVAEFDALVGLDTLRAVHLNDSKHARGSHKDEHTHIGEGEIGVEGMRAVINHPALHDRPLVLETPVEDGKGDAWNVERVRELRAS
ncbi:MAG: deoxyribonuclease IV [Halobacteriales archaeon]